MRFTEDFNNYIRNLSPADRERELERVGYYAAGHGRPRRPGRTSVQGFPAPPRHSDPFSYTESMGSSMVNEAGAGFQNMASGGYEIGSNMPISEFRNDKKQALESGMQRFGMSADALRNIAKTVGIRRLDSSNDLKMIQDHFDKNPKSNPENRGTSTIDVFGLGVLGADMEAATPGITAVEDMASFMLTCPTTLEAAVVAITAAMGVVRLDGSREAGINLLKAISSITVTGIKTVSITGIKIVSITGIKVNDVV